MKNSYRTVIYSRTYDFVINDSVFSHACNLLQSEHHYVGSQIFWGYFWQRNFSQKMPGINTSKTKQTEQDQSAHKSIHAHHTDTCNCCKKIVVQLCSEIIIRFIRLLQRWWNCGRNSKKTNNRLPGWKLLASFGHIDLDTDLPRAWQNYAVSEVTPDQKEYVVKQCTDVVLFYLVMNKYFSFSLLPCTFHHSSLLS